MVNSKADFYLALLIRNIKSNFYFVTFLVIKFETNHHILSVDSSGLIQFTKYNMDTRWLIWFNVEVFILMNIKLIRKCTFLQSYSLDMRPIFDKTINRVSNGLFVQWTILLWKWCFKMKKGPPQWNQKYIYILATL